LCAISQHTSRRCRSLDTEHQLNQHLSYFNETFPDLLFISRGRSPRRHSEENAPDKGRTPSPRPDCTGPAALLREPCAPRRVKAETAHTTAFPRPGRATTARQPDSAGGAQRLHTENAAFFRVTPKKRRARRSFRIALYALLPPGPGSRNRERPPGSLSGRAGKIRRQTKISLARNTRQSPIIRGLASLAFPVASLSTTKEMMPNSMPWAML